MNDQTIRKDLEIQINELSAGLKGLNIPAEYLTRIEENLNELRGITEATGNGRHEGSMGRDHVIVEPKEGEHTELLTRGDKDIVGSVINNRSEASINLGSNDDIGFHAINGGTLKEKSGPGDDASLVINNDGNSTHAMGTGDDALGVINDGGTTLNKLGRGADNSYDMTSGKGANTTSYGQSGADNMLTSANNGATSAALGGKGNDSIIGIGMEGGRSVINGGSGKNELVGLGNVDIQTKGNDNVFVSPGALGDPNAVARAYLGDGSQSVFVTGQNGGTTIIEGFNPSEDTLKTLGECGSALSENGINLQNIDPEEVKCTADNSGKSTVAVYSGRQ